ncbi:MAG: hypothetical protein LKE53_06420 [Oscillospiraceae bacterium]|jgi:subtilisin-like proprotein convertase family protein|nr:hypothetical protein [Oscillospiraceae bacterium]
MIYTTEEQESLRKISDYSPQEQEQILKNSAATAEDESSRLYFKWLFAKVFTQHHCNKRERQ